MTLKNFARFAPFVLMLLLAGCGGGGAEEARAYCPQPFTVQDAGRLTHFREGAGRDPRDVEWAAQLGQVRATCTLRKSQMEVNLILRIAVAAGPSVSAAPTRVPYFVRVIGSQGTVVQGQDFIADFKLSSGTPRSGSQEELSLSLPYSKLADLNGYRIAVGLKPTMAELDYNRRGGQ
ncbi:MAG: hypothetical protein EPO67_00970 [Reyranella sp.]|jgi:hypothetical protein|nr:MAG: hypothetical protein EPO67_00970 [Reyranella sp.]